MKEQQKAYERAYRNSQPQYYPQYQQPYYPQYQAPQNNGGYYYPQYNQPQYYPQYSQPQYYPQYSEPYYPQNYGYQTYSQPYYYPQSYGYSGYPYGGGYYPARSGFSGKDLIRNLIFSILGSQLGLGDVFDQGYPRYVYGIPTSNQYDPYYTTAGYYDPYNTYSTRPYAAAYYSPIVTDPYLVRSDLPVEYLLSSDPTDGFTRDTLSRLLAVGYEQGFNDGLMARRTAVRNRSYYDPYAYQEDVYDPYSVSLGENRRCLSEGYELGYQDALRNDRIAYANVQNAEVDLVSALIGTVSQVL
jgi:hypothetical protein